MVGGKSGLVSWFAHARTIPQMRKILQTSALIAETHSFGIFIVEGKNQGWARCIGVLLEVQVSSDDGFPIF